MRITRVQWTGYRLPFRRSFVSVATRAEARYGLLLRLETDEQQVGLGEASPLGVGDEQAVAQLAEELKQVVPELSAITLTGDAPSLGGAIGGASAPLRFGLETALHDLLGQARRQSMTALIGGMPKPVPVNALIAAETPEEGVQEAERVVAEGFTTLKLKIGGASIERDVALVSAVRQAVGPGIKLRADANGAWEVGSAVRAIWALDSLGLEYIEQPVPANDVAGLAAVRRAVRTPIAADEAVTSPANARKLLELGAADVLVVKAARLGLLGAAEVLRLAEQAGKPAVVTSSLESGVGLAASLHLATLASWQYAQGLATGLLLERDLLTTPLTPTAGMLHCPDAPGLGVALDERAVRRYATDITRTAST